MERSGPLCLGVNADMKGEGHTWLFLASTSCFLSTFWKRLYPVLGCQIAINRTLLLFRMPCLYGLVESGFNPIVFSINKREVRDISHGCISQSFKIFHLQGRSHSAAAADTDLILIPHMVPLEQT